MCTWLGNSLLRSGLSRLHTPVGSCTRADPEWVEAGDSELWSGNRLPVSRQSLLALSSGS